EVMCGDKAQREDGTEYKPGVRTTDDAHGDLAGNLVAAQQAVAPISSRVRQECGHTHQRGTDQADLAGCRRRKRHSTTHAAIVAAGPASGPPVTDPAHVSLDPATRYRRPSAHIGRQLGWPHAASDRRARPAR